MPEDNYTTPTTAEIEEALKDSYDASTKPVAPPEEFGSDYPPKNKGQCHKAIRDILDEYGGMESNIPHNHDYWAYVNMYRLYESEGKS